jgi:hypothetical protein
MGEMARDDEDDLYDEEFDFVDDDDDDEVDDDDTDEADESDEADKDADVGEQAVDKDNREDEPGVDEGEEAVDEYGRPEQVPANYVVHIYEHKKFKRTIERPFTAEDAEAFATEFNRTSKSYGRVALTSKNDAKPKKALD